MNAELLTAILASTVVAATPLVYAAVGELVAEKAGVLNLGVEGMMLMGAVTGFAVAFQGHSHLTATIFACLAGAAAALVFAIPALTLGTNQYATGLALTIICSGLSSLLGRGFGGAPVEAAPPLAIPMLASIPILGPVLFQHHVLVYGAMVAVPLVAFFLHRTKLGLTLRVIGESPTAAQAIGHNVLLVRYAATIFGGAMAGLAGAFLALSYTPIWLENMTAGKGWIALALVVFSGWRLLRLVIGALLFGGLTIGQLFVQAAGLPVASEVLSGLPYLFTIIALVVLSRRMSFVRTNFPASLAKPFRPAI